MYMIVHYFVHYFVYYFVPHTILDSTLDQRSKSTIFTITAFDPRAGRVFITVLLLHRLVSHDGHGGGGVGHVYPTIILAHTFFVCVLRSKLRSYIHLRTHLRLCVRHDAKRHAASECACSLYT